MGLEFTLVDVFTDRPFGGNQLAVFPDARGISDETMQRLAREFNFSETTFVLPPADPAHSCRVRIFTPEQELPFAGHPTVGTAAVLAGSAGERWELVLEEGIGPVTVAGRDGVVELHLRAPACESAAEQPPVEAVAEAVGLAAGEVVEAWYAGLGVRFCFVRLADAAAVDRAALDRGAWAAGIAHCWSPQLYLFAGDIDAGGGRLHARLFAPGFGIDEDPATGSACAALTAALAERTGPAEGTFELHIDQGVAMGRPSALRGTAHRSGGRTTEVVVAGQVVVVGSGTMTVPPG